MKITGTRQTISDIEATSLSPTFLFSHRPPIAKNIFIEPHSFLFLKNFRCIPTNNTGNEMYGFARNIAYSSRYYKSGWKATNEIFLRRTEIELKNAYRKEKTGLLK